MGTLVASGGTWLSAYGQLASGQSERKIALQNQKAYNVSAAANEAIAIENMAIAGRDAAAIERKGLAGVKLTRKEIGRLLAYQRVQEAVSGFRYEGTPINVAIESALEGEQDVAMIWSNALTDAERVRAGGRVQLLEGERIAGQLRTQGDIVAQQGIYAARAGYFGAGATLLQGFGAYQRYKPQTTPTKAPKPQTTVNRTRAPQAQRPT